MKIVSQFYCRWPASLAGRGSQHNPDRSAALLIWLGVYHLPFTFLLFLCKVSCSDVTLSEQAERPRSMSDTVVLTFPRRHETSRCCLWSLSWPLVAPTLSHQTQQWARSSAPFGKAQLFPFWVKRVVQFSGWLGHVARCVSTYLASSGLPLVPVFMQVTRHLRRNSGRERILDLLKTLGDVLDGFLVSHCWCRAPKTKKLNHIFCRAYPTHDLLHELFDHAPGAIWRSYGFHQTKKFMQK